MKKLNSPSKKLNADNSIICKIFLFLFVTGTSCTRHASNSSELTAAQISSPSSPALVSVVDPIRESWIGLRSIASATTPDVVRVSAKSCIDQKFVFGTSLRVLGQLYEIILEEEAGHLSLAIIEDSETKLQGFEISKALKDSICGESGNFIGKTTLIDSVEYLALVKTILGSIAKIVPDCKSLDVDALGVHCNLDALKPQPALVRTDDFQKSMIRKWSRQPYILARRTGVVSTLARTASNLQNDDGFSKFCRVLQFSLPEELPIVMTSRRWQNALCSGQGKLREEAAYFGLAKGTQELSMLRELYEGTSRVGLLSVRIPNQIIPGRAMATARQPLRVTIAPDEEVSKKLVDEARQYLGRPDKEERPHKLVRNKRHGRNSKFYETINAYKRTEAEALEIASRTDMCWHPVFSETWGLLKIADGMKLTGDGFKQECGFIYERDGATEKELASLSKYLLQSLSSETEFVIDNGQSKLLRLPEGRYQYTVQVLPANPLDSEDADDENTPKTSGELGWGSSRNHAIKSW